MFVVTNRIPVAKGFEKDFEDRFKNRAHLVDQFPGFIKNNILKPTYRRKDHKTGEWIQSEELGYYLVQTHWNTEEDFWKWTQSEEFRKAHSNRPPAEMFAGENVMETHEIVLTTEKKA